MPTKISPVGSSASGGGSGDVVGPASSTDNALARFDSTTGKLLKNSTVICDNSGNLTGVGTINSVKVYRALLTQSSTDAPVATVLENTLGGAVVWGYVAAGRYTATLAGAFTANKTFITAGNGANADGSLTGFLSTARNDSDSFNLRTTPNTDLLNNADDLLLATAIEILVYP